MAFGSLSHCTGHFVWQKNTECIYVFTILEARKSKIKFTAVFVSRYGLSSYLIRCCSAPSLSPFLLFLLSSLSVCLYKEKIKKKNRWYKEKKGIKGETQPGEREWSMMESWYFSLRPPNQNSTIWYHLSVIISLAILSLNNITLETDINLDKTHSVHNRQFVWTTKFTYFCWL